MTTSMAVLFSAGGGMAERLDRTEFDNEKSMRDMLLRHPDMIPVYEIDEDLRLLTIKRELRVHEAGSDKFADAVAVDNNGSLYLIEAKLFKNPDKRQVVAQALSYGASLWASSQSSGEFLSILDEACMDLFEKQFLAKVKDFYALDDVQAESFKDALSKNWDEGVFKFVIYMDRVGDDLKNLVTYLNKRSKFDLYLVGVDYYRRGGDEIIIPKIYGVPDRKEVGTASAKPQRTGAMLPEEFLESAKARLGPGFEIFDRLFGFLREFTGDGTSFRTNSYGGSYTPRFSNLQNIGLFSLKADGTLQVYLSYLDDEGLLNESAHLRKRLVDEGLIPTSTTSRQPMISLPIWSGKVDVVVGMIKEMGQ